MYRLDKLILALLWMTAARAAAAQPDVAAKPAMPTDQLGNVLIGLLVVLAAIAGAAWVARRVMRVQPGTGDRLKVIGGVSLGTRERLVLVQAEGTRILLGVAPGRVQTLHVLDAGAGDDGAAANPGNVPGSRTATTVPRGSPFNKLLQRWQGHRGNEVQDD